MFFYHLVIATIGNESRPDVIFNLRRLLLFPLVTIPIFLAVFMYFHVGSEEVLIKKKKKKDLSEFLIHINALNRMEINS